MWTEANGGGSGIASFPSAVVAKFSEQIATKPKAKETKEARAQCREGGRACRERSASFRLYIFLDYRINRAIRNLAG